MSAATPFDDLEPCDVLTCEQVARRLAVHPRSVRRAVARGDLVASRACGIRILAADAAAWWRAGMVAPDRGDEARTPGRARPSKRFVRSTERLPLPPRTGGV